ncbi:MAG: ribonuclease HII [Bacteroidales bacterium]|nr:ribonuclease HII [Bacteroidales bacterium]
MLKAYHTAGKIEAGCDEAGRGCLAGPVFAAAVILPKDYSNPNINDSKTLSEKQRKNVRKEIENVALAWAVAKIDHDEIDVINILNASFKAMNTAVNQLKITPECLLIDGNRFINNTQIPHICIVKGDGKYLSIAAASILAKTCRDEYMELLAEEYPHYLWQKNKGYPTPEHREAIAKHGISAYHRKSFRLLPTQLSLDL